jgi:hypothetical protein
VARGLRPTAQDVRKVDSPKRSPLVLLGKPPRRPSVTGICKIKSAWGRVLLYFPPEASSPSGKRLVLRPGAACAFQTWRGENVLTRWPPQCIFWVGFLMQTYTIYTQCDHCGIYDRNPQWCALCQRPKEARRRENAKAPVTDPPKADDAAAGGLARRTARNSV